MFTGSDGLANQARTFDPTGGEITSIPNNGCSVIMASLCQAATDVPDAKFDTACLQLSNDGASNELGLCRAVGFRGFINCCADMPRQPHP